MINEEELIELFKSLHDEEIIEEIYELSMLCNTINISEEIAKKWLKRYGIQFHYQHQKTKEYYKKLLAYARIINLEIPFDLDINDFSSDEVINRMLENASLTISKLEEENDTESIEIINSFYDSIIAEYKKSNICNKDFGKR